MVLFPVVSCEANAFNVASCVTESDRAVVHSCPQYEISHSAMCLSCLAWESSRVCPENASCYGVLLAASLEVNMCSKPNVTTEKIKDLRKALPIFFSIVLSVYSINNIMLEYYVIFNKLSKIE